MFRVPEPEVMDNMAESIAYDLMDFREVNQAFVDRAIALGITEGKILDAGTGTARIPILLAQALLSRGQRNFQITAIDLAATMLQLGRQHLLTADLEDYISLQLVDAKDMPYPNHSFDSIISNSIVHHLSDPKPFFQELARLLKPNSGLLLRDLLRPQSSAELDYLVNRYAGDCDPEQKKLFRDSLLASYTLAEIESLLAVVHIERVKVYQSSDRHWTVEREYIFSPCS